MTDRARWASYPATSAARPNFSLGHLSIDAEVRFVIHEKRNYVQKRAIMTIAISRRGASSVQIGPQIGVTMLTSAHLANKSDEPPLAYPGAAVDSERAKRPPLPEPPYKPYEKIDRLKVPYEPYKKKPGPPYKPYADKPVGSEEPYEPYKGM